MGTAVEFKNVSYTYPLTDTPAIKDMSFKLEQGKFYGVIGANGSGKTTLCSLIRGFAPSFYKGQLDGQVLINGVPTVDHKPGELSLKIGYVFQNPFNQISGVKKTIFEEVAFGLENFGVPPEEIERRVVDVMRRTNITELAEKNPFALSGGQQQRVALARALVFEPRLVLMDEPLGALDKQLREHMQLEIKQLHDKFGLTIVYVTHDQSEALTMSDRVAVFHKGEIQQIDAPKVLYEEPKTAFVAQFIGENNQIHGTIASIDGDHCEVKLADGTLLKALAINIAAVGEATTVSVRPERILLGEAAKSCDNLVSGRIKEFVYLGDHIRLCLDTCGSAHFVVKIPAGQFDGNIKFGDELHIGWQREYTRALDVMD